MAKYRVWIEREQCISCGLCASSCPDIFEMNPEDNKSQIIEKWRKDPSKNNEGIIPEELRGCAEQAAMSCPVSIIHVEEYKE